jgi:peptide-methionine (S)-S-oxide reductase
VSDVATFGGGCFWCLDGAFRQLRGVESIVSGYAGGRRPNPTYEQVCAGVTGHAEVVQITFDANIVSYRDLLGVLFTIHDPTTPNRQGNDVGTQYRSVILYHSPEQERDARAVIAELERERVWDEPIVTEVVPFSVFYPAEGYHQDYFNKNPNQPYCSAIVAPKVAKVRKAYFDRLVASR